MLAAKSETRAQQGSDNNGRMQPESEQSKSKRRARRFRRAAVEGVIAASFVIAVIIGDRLIGDGGASLSVRWLAAGLPIIVLSFWWVHLAREIRKLDEFEQSVEIRALAIAGAVTVWIATAWGIVSLIVGAPALPLAMTAPLAAIIFGAIRQIIVFSYR